MTPRRPGADNVLVRATASEVAAEALAELLREVVMDYGARCCDHPADCECSMARAYRIVQKMTPEPYLGDF